MELATTHVPRNARLAFQILYTTGDILKAPVSGRGDDDHRYPGRGRTRGYPPGPAPGSAAAVGVRVPGRAGDQRPTQAWPAPGGDRAGAPARCEPPAGRSEERRVGQEGSSSGSACTSK